MTIRCGLAVLGMLALTSLAAAQESKRLAVVNGEAVTEEQVLNAAGPGLEKLTGRPRLEAMWKALDSIVEDKLLAAEAAKLKMSKEELINIEIESNVVSLTDDEVSQFYEANKARIPIPREQALPQVRQFMMDQQRRVFRVPLIRRLRREFGVTTYLDPLRTEIATAGYPAHGPANAPVTIIEFADFECPFCGGLFPTLKLVERNYTDRVRFVYRHFPLTNIHPRAQKAAEAAVCANEQGRFWEFHDSMFGNQQQLAVDDLKRRAETMKLDTAAFNSCLDSGRAAEAVKKDAADGAKAGVTGTPAIFINGRMLSGNQPYNEIREIIEDELKRSR
ncbi:MAG TPA: DsbA family protein [Terriglobia bacterium]|nr:DsbA family protein [Terriglobia bacterium]